MRGAGRTTCRSPIQAVTSCPVLPLVVSQPVQQGEMVERVGDPSLTRTSRPHLHMEIRGRSLLSTPTC